MSMFSLLTSDDWTQATLTVDDGGAPQVFTFAADENSAYAGLEAFKAWLAASFPGDSMSWTWGRDDATAGANVIMETTALFTIVANAAAQSLTGLAASTGPDNAFESVWTGTWHPTVQLDMTRWVRWLRAPGPSSGVGALRGGSPGTSPRFPILRSLGFAIDISRLIDELANAARPRQAYVYQTHTQTWRLISVGKLDHSAAGPLINTIAFEVMG
jgi:hypothetical protein